MATNPHLVLPAVLAPRVHAGPLEAPVNAEQRSYRAPAVSPGPSRGDNQAYAAAELVRLGFATRVTLVNAPVDDALPDTWEIRGTPVGLVRLPASRSRLTAGPVTASRTRG
ncbi:MAG TPA: hypothetical protein VIZ22_04830 [Candidatus Limnocylindrales bacterium]